MFLFLLLLYSAFHLTPDASKRPGSLSSDQRSEKTQNVWGDKWASPSSRPAPVRSVFIPAQLAVIASELAQHVGGEEEQRRHCREQPFSLWESDQHFCFNLAQSPHK